MTETFNFPFHTSAEEFPATGYGVQFGNSYEFRSAPVAPPQRMWKLTMSGLRYITSAGVISRSLSPTVNILFFKDFYAAHQLHTSFFYVHETEGTIKVRFKEPLKLPTAIPNSGGIFPPFDITIVEQP